MLVPSTLLKIPGEILAVGRTKSAELFPDTDDGGEDKRNGCITCKLTEGAGDGDGDGDEEGDDNSSGKDCTMEMLLCSD